MHKTLNPDKDFAYWNYSFHEMGLYDIPAFINKIKTVTGVDKITYIGHSQGTSQMFAGISKLPDYYKSVLNGFIALGPVTYMDHIGSNFISMAANYNIDIMLQLIRVNEILNSITSLQRLEIILCQRIGILCRGLLDLLADRNVDDDDLKRFLVFVGHFPSGSSTKSLRHFAQNVRSGNFADPDFRPYPIENIKDIPIGLFVGKDDRLATVLDNQKLKMDLEDNNSLMFYREYDNMGHSTFFLNKDNVYVDDVVALLEKFHKK
jgi:lysosomal acid lipase/cholesteryl ester hydrolase